MRLSEAAKWHAAARVEWPVIAFAGSQDAFECRGPADHRPTIKPVRNRFLRWN